MSDGISKMYDNYDYYCTLCEKYKEVAHLIQETEAWLHHYESLKYEENADY